MSVVKEYFEETEALLVLLKKERRDRDSFLQEIETVVEKRQALIQSMKPPYTEEEERIGKHCMLLDKEVDALLQHEKQQIQLDINGLKKHKQSRQKYVNPYQSLQTDGMFYDKKK